MHTPSLVHLAEGPLVGFEFSGVVARAPAGSKFAVGDRVSGGVEHSPTNGPFAEYVVVEDFMVRKCPLGVSAEEGATFTTGWLTAALGVEQRLVDWVRARGLPEDTRSTVGRDRIELRVR